MLPISSIRTEARGMFALALPVVIDQVGMMSMGIIDTIMVGRLGADSLGAVGIAAAVYFFFMVFAWGTISAVSPVVAHAFGAGDAEEIGRSVAQGFWLALFLFGLGLVVIENVESILLALGQSPDLVVISGRYVDALRYGMIANLWYSVLRGLTVGLGRTRVTMVISLLAAAVNLVLDYGLIYGKFGLPALGVEGAGYATSLVNWFMFAAAAWYVFSSKDFRSYPIFRYLFRIDPKRMMHLLRLGVPIGIGSSMEHGVFSFTTILMGQIGRIPLASHQVAINVAAFTFMTPLGISTAITTRVGQAIGRGDRDGATLAGWVGIGMAGLFMMGTALVFILIPETIIGVYTNDLEVLHYASGLLVIAGAFQFVDGIQVASLGALRGLKDTTVPMVTNIIAYWGVGLPTGYYLAFNAGLGGQGLWWGLTTGLAVASLMHSLRFRRLTRSVRDRGDAVPSG